MLCRLSSALVVTAFIFSSGTFGGALADEICTGYGPQAPRDISKTSGANPIVFNLAPGAKKMSLCNLHTHTNAEHKGPGFSIFAGKGEHGGYRCNGTDKLTAAELKDPTDGQGAYKAVKPGDTIEVHWVYSSCDITPGETLAACMNDKCVNPVLRVEAQVFLVVNDPNAIDFADFAYAGDMVNWQHQPKALPTGTGEPVVYTGSTTGKQYTQSKCSPFQVTWSVRPNCAKIDINSLHKWAEGGNIFKETASHGVRQLVTETELLSGMK